MTSLASVTGRAGRLLHRRAEQRSETRVAAADPAAAPYLGLTPRSLALATLRVGRVPARVNLVVPGYVPGATFAGIKTALETGVLLADLEGRDLRVVALRGVVTPAAEQALRDFVRAELARDGRRVSLVAADGLSTAAVSEDDLWVVTYWTTAHTVDVACRLGLVDRSRVVYLVQDYEPSFLPASTPGALARSTYHAGFALLVNSSPLADYLRRFEGIEVPSDRVFAPSLDLERLAQTHGARTAGRTPTVLFYGRPSKPRNMYPLGVAALRVAARRSSLPGVRYLSVGERHADVRLAPDQVLRSVGTLSWSGYFELLATADVLLSLQASPHPSHPPLDAVVSGGRAVTNELGGTRAGRHARLVAASADPDELGSAVGTALEQAHTEGPGAFVPELLGRFGRPLPDAARAAVAQLVR